jgi:uncharacterized protein
MNAEQFAQESARTPWILTYTGRRVNPLALRVEDVDILDIAHHLATINRWCGALSEPISVAQHSVHVSWLCDGSDFELEALLHDASEAYLGEVTKWLKNSDCMIAYREAEDRATEVVSRKFDLVHPLPLVVEKADALMVGVEGQFGIRGWKPFPGYDLPSADTLRRAQFHSSWTWREAEAQFITRFSYIVAKGRHHVAPSTPKRSIHLRSCPAYGNYQPPYETCNCGVE